MTATLAAQVLDVLDEFGECRVANVANVANVRRAIRAEARRRQVKVHTAVLAEGYVIATVPRAAQSVTARAFGEITRALIPDVIEAALSGDPAAGTFFDIGLRTVDAEALG